MCTTEPLNPRAPSRASANWLVAVLAVAVITANLAVQWLAINAGP